MPVIEPFDPCRGRGGRVPGLALAIALLVGPPAVAGQDVGALEGTFVWDSTASDDVGAAIDAATSDVGFMHRRFVRGHLWTMTRPYRTVTIERDETSVSIATDGGEPIRAPASGEPVEWTRGDGERMHVSIVTEDGAVRQAITGTDEQRENLLRLDAGGRTLVIAVTVRTTRLDDVIRFELVYRRER